MSPRGISFRPACVTMPRLESRIDAARESHPFLAFQSFEIDPSGTIYRLYEIFYIETACLSLKLHEDVPSWTPRVIFSIEVIDRARTSPVSNLSFHYLHRVVLLIPFSLFVINVSEKRSSSEKVSRKNTYARREFRSPCSLGDSEGSG